VLRVYRIPFSTNVERVALALAHKRLAVEWVDVDPADRSPVVAASGQPLVPVLVDGDAVVADSTRILHHLEERFPEPPLFPREPARRAEVELFLQWFDRVWKGPPNAIEAELGRARPDEERVAGWGAELRGWLDLFEELLAGRDHLFGEFSVADCSAFPFLRYALLHDPRDRELFHRILVEWLALEGRHPRLEAWIRRVDERPRA
jgi:glutathione S-transferase